MRLCALSMADCPDKPTFVNNTLASHTCSKMKSLRNYVSLGALFQIASKPLHVFGIPRYLRELRAYRNAELASFVKPSALRLYPCLGDRQSEQFAHGSYFYQDCWAARQVFREAPNWGVDVGSTVLLVGILSQFRPWQSVDIRPVRSQLDGLRCISGSILSLPFEDNSVPCLTTMCVLEHIGLGR